MAHTLAGAIANIQDKAGTLSGFRQAPDFAKESVNQLPAAIAFPKTSQSLIYGYQVTKCVEVVTVLLLFAGGSVPKAIEKADQYFDDFLVLLRNDPALGENCSHIISVSGTFGVISYGKQSFIGWTIDVEFQRDLATS